MDTALGNIVSFDETGMTVHIPIKEISVDKAILKRYKNVLVGLPDARMISPEQRKIAHVLLADIADFSCGSRGQSEVEDMKAFTKQDFLLTQQSQIYNKIFSLRDCDVTTAREYITYLIDFIIKHDIPPSQPLIKLCDDVERMVYSCLLYKRCAICQKPADLHHFDQIGMGNDRTQIYQIGMRVISLCRRHHGMAHDKGRSWLLEEQHLTPIPLDIKIGKVYKLSKNNLLKESV